MYFPYIRGKQFDLLALKALLEQDCLSDAIQPIIEPVKQSKTFWTTIDLFQRKQHPFYLVRNPQAGAFLTAEGLAELQNVAAPKAMIVDRPIETVEEKPDLWIIHQADQALASDWRENTLPVLVSKEFRLLNKINGPKLLMEDPFTRLPKNSFYTECPDEGFSKTHHLYHKLGYAGFSDFSVDSKIYHEHSYPSKRLVLHWIYPTAEQDLRIVHLFSEEELPSQKEKFFEVMEALLQHEEEYPTQTAGLQLLVAAYQQRSFPGMGVIRKAAVMNHLELVSRLI